MSSKRTVFSSSTTSKTQNFHFACRPPATTTTMILASSASNSATTRKMDINTTTGKTALSNIPGIFQSRRFLIFHPLHTVRGTTLATKSTVTFGGWSYRTADDEEGISPYGGETMSTAAHHASALTLTAGLGGGRAARRDPSLSGAEYDPERPLHAMIAGVNSKHSLFDRTKNTVSTFTIQHENVLNCPQNHGHDIRPPRRRQYRRARQNS